MDAAPWRRPGSGGGPSLAERLRAGTNLAQAYTSFSGIHADMDGTVKFIYRTDAIESAQ